MINENQHYSSSEIQPIEFTHSIFKNNNNITGFEAACIKDIIKYVGRYGKKDDKVKEAGKILDYALWLYLEAQGYMFNPRVHTHTRIMNYFNNDCIVSIDKGVE